DNPALDGTITGVVNADNITATYATTATSASPVGDYAIAPTLVDPDGRLGNYTVTKTPGTLSVGAVALTVTATDKARGYGADNPALDGTITGVVNADNITATYATTATSASPVGNYGIAPTLVDPDGRLGNYTVTKTNGTLSVGAVALTVTATDKARGYGA